MSDRSISLGLVAAALFDIREGRMDGRLDSTDQAWLSINLKDGLFDFLIDTGFSGTLVVGEEVIDTTFLTWLGECEAELTAGESATFQIYKAEIEWLGLWKTMRVYVGPGSECLLGTEILKPHRLEIDYSLRTVSLILKSIN